MTSNPLTPAESTDLRQIVYNKIRDAIIMGIIKPGEKLSETELAQTLAVSRTPIREAIRQLAQTGIVKLVPRKGAFVTLPTEKDVNDLYEVRIALETIAVKRICKKGPKEELLRFREYFASVDHSTDPNAFLLQDTAFHSFLRNSCDNRFLNQFLMETYDLIQLYRHYSIKGVDLKESSMEHVRLIDAILEKDEERAIRLLQNHLEGARDALLAFLKDASPAGEPD
ncbi:GntR family transcriptional regulator [Acetomicrobium sp. UBA5826]|uniref:GntR family transcriptional regulator n=1 Tax=Acetomicrobium sp. UBA5826 TaxID=1946039 RepID=UPI0025805284|nr:GntR family transcriptional regulator [Acetomicrobium sp. UBA5826]